MEQKLFTKNFTLLISGQASSLFGNLILKLALSMHVLEVTGSAAIFAGILSIATIPTIVLSPLGGILADRADKRNVMVGLDTLTGISVLCAALFLSKTNNLAAISVLLVILSILGAFETPTVQACVPSMLSGNLITKGNAVVNQVASVACLVAPALGGILYAAFGLIPVMYASIACFFATALFECFIKLGYGQWEHGKEILSTIKQDLSHSIRFMVREQPSVLKLMVFIALSRFFVMGTAVVGLPYMVRTILGLNAAYYGAVESALAVAAILGSAAAGMLTNHLNMGRLSLMLAAIGACLIPAGIAFLLPAGVLIKYLVIMVSFWGMQLLISIFSIFAVSGIQQETPNHLIGKVMSYLSALSICVQPMGQLLYGYLFDEFSNAVYLVLIPTGVIACMAGLLSKGFFRSLDKEM